MRAAEGGAGDPAARLRATLDSLLDPHVVLTAVRDGNGEIVDFEYTDANAAACDYNGLSYDELMGTHLLEFLPNHRSTGMFDRYKHLIETGEPLVIDDFVYPLERRGGQEVHFDIRGVALGDSIVYSWRDITDRHEQMKALREAEREYRSLAEATTDLAYRTDAQRRIVWVSPSVTRVLGWDPDDMLGRTIQTFIPPEEMASHRDNWDSAYSGDWVPDGPQSRVFPVLTKSGDTLPMTTVVTRDMDDDGQWTGGLLIGLRDVTDVLREQEAAEREREKAERLQLSMDRAAVGLAISGLDGGFEYVNPALCRMLRYRQEELTSMSFSDITHPEDVDASQAMMGRLLSNEVDELTMRKRYLTATGETIWVDLAVGVARRRDGALDHFVAQVVDVTAEVEYAEALETTVRRFRELAENASDIVYEMDVDWRIRWISPSVQNVLGWDPETLVGANAPDILAGGQEELLADFRRQLRAGYSVNGTSLKYSTASGLTRWMSAMINPISDGDDIAGVIVGLRDVTNEVEARQALARVQERLRLAVDAAPNGMAITDDNGLLVDVNRQFCRLLDSSEQEVVGLPLEQVLTVAGAGTCAGDRVLHEHRRLVGDTVEWIEHEVAEVPDEGGSSGYLVHLFSNATREHRVREELRHLATHDVLTGVANRRWFADRLQHVGDADDRGTIAIVFCDVDRLKEVNDTLGHAAGDAVLTAVAERLASAIRASDDIGRLGGDEFVVLLEGVASAADLQAIAEKIRRQVEGDVSFQGRSIRVSTSVGATFVRPGEDPDAALQRADAALLLAKSQGRNQAVVTG